MPYKPFKYRTKRRGAVAVKIVLLLIPIMGMFALAIDYGYLLKVRTDLQRAADLAALAAVRDLVPEANGNQDLAAVRATVRQYADANIQGVANLQVPASDIEIGRYDPSTIYSNLTILNDGDFDTVRVTVRRDTQANSPVSLFFARVIGMSDSGVNATATAVLRKASTLRPGNAVLPFAVPNHVWDSHRVGDSWKIYTDGKIQDSLGNSISGNWGTVDIGDTNNSTAELSAQISNGLTQSDLDALYRDGRISTNAAIDTSETLSLQGESGLSSGISSAVLAIEGQVRYIPIFNTITGSGNAAEFNIIGWGAVKVLNSNWQGETWIRIEKTTTYDLDLQPHYDLSNTSETIDGAFTTAALAE